jgi:hypothetical protein
MPTSNLQGTSPKARRVADALGTVKGCAVVQGANSREVVRPSAANVRIEGIALYVSAQNEHVAVQDMGEAVCIAASAIAIGAEVNVADTTGRFKAVSEGAGVVAQVCGRAKTAASASGDQFTLEINRYARTI